MSASHWELKEQLMAVLKTLAKATSATYGELRGHYWMCVSVYFFLCDYVIKLLIDSTWTLSD